MDMQSEELHFILGDGRDDPLDDPSLDDALLDGDDPLGLGPLDDDRAAWREEDDPAAATPATAEAAPRAAPRPRPAPSSAADRPGRPARATATARVPPSPVASRRGGAASFPGCGCGLPAPPGLARGGSLGPLGVPRAREVFADFDFAAPAAGGWSRGGDGEEDDGGDAPRRAPDVGADGPADAGAGRAGTTLAALVASATKDPGFRESLEGLAAGDEEGEKERKEEEEAPPAPSPAPTPHVIHAASRRPALPGARRRHVCRGDLEELRRRAASDARRLSTLAHQPSLPAGGRGARLPLQRPSAAAAARRAPPAPLAPPMPPPSTREAGLPESGAAALRRPSPAASATGVAASRLAGAAVAALPACPPLHPSKLCRHPGCHRRTQTRCRGLCLTHARMAGMTIVRRSKKRAAPRGPVPVVHGRKPDPVTCKVAGKGTSAPVEGVPVGAAPVPVSAKAVPVESKPAPITPVRPVAAAPRRAPAAPAAPSAPPPGTAVDPTLAALVAAATRDPDLWRSPTFAAALGAVVGRAGGGAPPAPPA